MCKIRLAQIYMMDFPLRCWRVPYYILLGEPKYFLAGRKVNPAILSKKTALAFRSSKIPSNWDLGWDNLSTSLSSTFDPSSTLKESGSNSEPRSAKPQEVHWSWEKQVRISGLALWFGIPNVPPISNLEGLCEDDQSITWGVGWNLTPPVTH